MHARIDFFPTSDLLFDAICKTDIIPSIGTHHSAIIIEFKQKSTISKGKEILEIPYKFSQ